MKNYSYTIDYNNYPMTKSTKTIHLFWSDKLDCGVEYHTSNKTEKVVYFGLYFGNNIKIKLPNNTKLEEGVNTLESLYKTISNKVTKPKKTITTLDELDSFYESMYEFLEKKI